MELCEKIQALRKQKGLTQEELAEILFVSRTAISKWESGRGYPNIDSLKAISRYFGISIDELLSGEELLTIAEEDTRQNKLHQLGLLFALFDCSTAMFLFLPFFGMKSEEAIRAVSLLNLENVSGWLKIVYLLFVALSVLVGITTLVLQYRWLKKTAAISLGLNALGILILIVTNQPYAGGFLFIFFIIRFILVLKTAPTRSVSSM